MKGIAATIDDLSAALALADAHGLSAEEKRKLKKKVGTVLCMPDVSRRKKMPIHRDIDETKIR